MPKVVLKSVYSFSSEDPAFPASNLLKSLKWRTQGVGQESEHVTFQLDKPTIITGIDLGNECSCFIGVFVARCGQEMNTENYREILLTSSFMTPVECRSLENINRVRCFSKTSLVEEVAKEKWDFVKVVCSQPFNAHTQYGLSFITIYSPEEEVKEESSKLDTLKSPSALGRFALREESPETDDRGTLFSKWKQSKDSDQGSSSSVNVTPALAIRKASAELLTKKTTSENDKPNKPTVEAAKTPKVEPPRRNRIINHSDDSDEDDSRVSVAKKPKPNEETKPKRPERAVEVKSPPKRVSYQPFGQLLSGVIYTISGIQNPERGNLRQKATEMGARYKPDWDSSCTHLICAFKNTPKYNQVRGLGKIVQKDWILNCYTKKTRFPWRRYALDRQDRDESESEDEVHDEARRPPGEPQSQATSSRNRIVDSDSDTDDEIQRVLAAKAPQKDIYDKTTEEEDEGQS